ATSSATPGTLDQSHALHDALPISAGNAGATCRVGSGDVCDPDEVCTGTSTSCPTDVFESSSYVCRAAGGECDVAENCPGTAGGVCPADTKKTSGTACTSDGNPCTLDQCNGTSVTCQHPAGNAGATLSLHDALPIDPDEVCTGTSASCPTDVLESSSYVCRAAGGECDVAENCPGTAGGACPADTKK